MFLLNKKALISMVKSVISDLGKVIINFDNHIFFKKIANYCPFTEHDIAELVFENFELIHYFDTGKISPEEFYKEVICRLKAEIDNLNFYAIYNDVFSLNPPVLDVLKRVRSRSRLILLSNTDVMRFGFVKKKFPEILIFDEYVLSYEVGFMKPHPQIFKEALRKAEAEAEECVFIDDIEGNIEAALSLGINTILFGPKTDLEAELQKKGLIL